MSKEDHIPVELDFSTPEESTHVQVGEISDPELFDVGFSPTIPDAILVYFHPSGEAEEENPHVLAFKGHAADKILQSFFSILFSMGAVPGQGESLGQPKKKITLH